MCEGIYFLRINNHLYIININIYNIINMSKILYYKVKYLVYITHQTWPVNRMSIFYDFGL